MKIKYKKIFLKSEKNFTLAEKLKAQGWRVILSAWDYILIEK
jgi:hypothetical protein